jgi:hypothetical protein
MRESCYPLGLSSAVVWVRTSLCQIQSAGQTPRQRFMVVHVALRMCPLVMTRVRLRYWKRAKSPECSLYPSLPSPAR